MSAIASAAATVPSMTITTPGPAVPPSRRRTIMTPPTMPTRPRTSRVMANTKGGLPIEGSGVASCGGRRGVRRPSLGLRRVGAGRIRAVERIRKRQCLSVEDLAHDALDLLTFLLGHLSPRPLGGASSDSKGYPVSGGRCDLLLDHRRQTGGSWCSVLTNERVPSLSAFN